MYRVFCLKSFAMTWSDNEQHMFGDKKKPATETMIVICYEMIQHHELLSK